jgi:molybdenum cofactor cytidylyltransferase
MDVVPAPVAALVLAGGRSTRLGRPKQLLPLRGRPVLQHVVDTAAAAGLAPVLVVLGYAADEVAAALRLPPAARVVVNPDHAAGQSTSLRAGLGALEGADAPALVVLLGDQPGVSVEAIEAVVRCHARGLGPIVQAAYDARPGHPVLFARIAWSDLARVEGDRGARDLLATRPDWVHAAPVPGPPPPDLDTWEDYERLLEAEGSA